MAEGVAGGKAESELQNCRCRQLRVNGQVLSPLCKYQAPKEFLRHAKKVAMVLLAFHAEKSSMLRYVKHTHRFAAARRRDEEVK